MSGSDPCLDGTIHAPNTLQVTKEAVRRLQADRRAASGDDLIARTYQSRDFKEGVRAFLEKARAALERHIAGAARSRGRAG